MHSWFFSKSSAGFRFEGLSERREPERITTIGFSALFGFVP